MEIKHILLRDNENQKESLLEVIDSVENETLDKFKIGHFGSETRMINFIKLDKY